jgi:small-conductance mechanosensitive channel
MTTIGGYIGFIIAILIGLSTAGVNFANIAIVAGALSVGIGFGLQNIVNNFVSGLILLFERPIKTGDWISVGGTEGFVKQISVRSTRIQTFDRADVIVPNSELISQQVTNRTLHDAFGRVTIPVGVAYGSDTELVRDLLLQIANDHPEVVKTGEVPPAQVLFQAFGDSTLNFELRCIIRNVSLVLVVSSEMNFAIDKRFREHKIEISFPQRDIWIRSWPELRTRLKPDGKTPDASEPAAD